MSIFALRFSVTKLYFFKIKTENTFFINASQNKILQPSTAWEKQVVKIVVPYCTSMTIFLHSTLLELAVPVHMRVVLFENMSSIESIHQHRFTPWTLHSWINP